MGYISVRTARDVGLLLRDARKRAKLDQATLAERLGVSRKWIIDTERGNEGAALGTILRALDMVGVRLASAVDAAGELPGKAKAESPVVDIDAIVDAARKRRR